MKVEIVHCPSRQNNSAKVASLVAFIKKRLNIEAVCTPGRTGQFDVLADSERIAGRGGNGFTRSFGGGYPDLEQVKPRPFFSIPELAERWRCSRSLVYNVIRGERVLDLAADGKKKKSHKLVPFDVVLRVERERLRVLR